MEYSRNRIVSIMQGYIGAVTGNAKHKAIVDTYNKGIADLKAKGKLGKTSPYVVKYTDAWCATTVSAAAFTAGYTDIIPPECSCTRMIELLKAKNSFEPNDNYIPSPGDILFFRWKIDGRDPIEAEDVDGISNHVGIVEKCDGKYITTIEGNYNDRCQRRKIKVGWKYIHGYGIPKYSDGAVYYIVKPGDSLSKIAAAYGYESYQDLLALNPDIKNPNLIRVGQKVRVK